MAWIERSDKRTQKNKIFQDSDNPLRFQLVACIHDQHYKDDADTWQDVDESVVDDGVDGFDKKCDKTRHIFRIGTGGNERWYPRRNVATEYVDITQIQYWWNNQWRTLNLPAAVWKQQGASWDMANLYAEIVNTWKKVATSFILKDATAPTRLRFAISLTGLTLNTTTWELTSTTDGLVWGYIYPPVFADANGENVPVTTTYSGGYIEWSVDATGATYPLTTDSLEFQDGAGGDVNTNKDNNINSGSVTDNYGTNTSIYVGEVNSAAAIRRSLLQFDVSSIAAEATCTTASLSIYKTGDFADNASVLEVYRMIRAWTETGSTWNRYDGISNWGTAGAGNTSTDREASNIGTYNQTDAEANGYKAITLTASAVQDWWDGGFTNNGVLIKTTDELNDAYQYASSDNATEAYRPKLVVVYEEGGCVEVIVDTEVIPINLTTVVVDWCEP